MVEKGQIWLFSTEHFQMFLKKYICKLDLAKRWKGQIRLFSTLHFQMFLKQYICKLDLAKSWKGQLWLFSTVHFPVFLKTYICKLDLDEKDHFDEETLSKLPPPARIGNTWLIISPIVNQNRYHILFLICFHIPTIFPCVLRAGSPCEEKDMSGIKRGERSPTCC